MRIRAARGAEAAELSALALRSKAHWGYDADFMEQCREELTLRPTEVEALRTVVAEQQGRVLGFATLRGEPPLGELGMLFVDPPAIGRGVGRLLFEHTLATAREQGFTRLTLDADPHAEGFYLAMGASRVGSAASGAIAGRVLPVLAVELQGR